MSDRETRMAGRLAGKTAIITGAASGIGAASARLFVAEGARVLAVDKPDSAIADAHAGVTGIVTLAQDVTARDAPARILDAAMTAHGKPDIVFNNAGVSRRAFAEDMTDEDWDLVLSVNVTAMFRICRAAIPVLREVAEAKGRARIINTASVMAFDTDLGLSAYTASKHAVAGLTKTLALELGKWRITANYVLPGAIQTGMTAKSFADPSIAAIWAKKAALRRLGEPVEIGRASCRERV